MLPPPDQDIENRLPVWMACSELYLDTELGDADLRRIGSICAQSPYSATELDTIMFNELYPALAPNLFAPAGEWTGWSAAFIKERVLQSYSPRWRLPWMWHPFKRSLRKEWLIVRSMSEDTGPAGCI